MIALDTNVLVRFLVEDDGEQTERARTLLKNALDANQVLFVSDVVVCELVWVLARSYKFQRVQIQGHWSFFFGPTIWPSLLSLGA